MESKRGVAQKIAFGEYTKIFPYGGDNPTKKPLHIEASIGIITGITIQGRTYGIDNCEVILFDEEKEEISRYVYDHDDNPFWWSNAAEDMANDMNILFELMGRNDLISPPYLFEIMNQMFCKCKSQCGYRLLDSEYDVLIYFV